MFLDKKASMAATTFSIHGTKKVIWWNDIAGNIGNIIKLDYITFIYIIKIYSFYNTKNMNEH